MALTLFVLLVGCDKATPPAPAAPAARKPLTLSESLMLVDKPIAINAPDGVYLFGSEGAWLIRDGEAVAVKEVTAFTRPKLQKP